MHSVLAMERSRKNVSDAVTAGRPLPMRIVRYGPYKGFLLLIILILFSTSCSLKTFTMEVDRRSPEDGLPGELFRKGYKAFLAHDYTTASDLLAGASKDGLLGDYALYFLGESLYALGRYDESLSAYLRLKDVYPRSLWADKIRLRLGDIFLERGNYVVAESIYNGVLDLTPSVTPEILLRLGVLHERMGDYRKAFRDYLRVWTDYPMTAHEARAASSMEALTLNNVDGVIISSSDHYRRALSLYRMANYREALSALNVVKENHGRLDDVVLLSGKIRYKLKDLEGAERDFRYLLSITTNDRDREEVLYWILQVALAAGDNGLAMDRIDTMLKLFPRGRYASSLHLRAAGLKKSEGDIDAAVRYLRRGYDGLSAGALKRTFLWRLAWYTYLAYDLDESDGYLKALYDDSGPAMQERALYWLGKIALKQGRRAEAFELFGRLAVAPVPTYYVSLARRELGAAWEGWPSGGAIRSLMDPGIRKRREGKPAFIKRARRLIDLDLYDLARGELLRALKVSRGTDVWEAIESAYILREGADFWRSLSIAEGYLGSGRVAGMPHIWYLSYPEYYKQWVDETAGELGLAPALVYAVIREESRFRPDALSGARARGLMQVIPSTGRYIAERLKFSGFVEDHLDDPRVNIRIGSWYLDSLLARFGMDLPLALAAYNAGPTNVSRWLKEKKHMPTEVFIEDMPFAETRRYVRKVLKSYNIYNALYGGSGDWVMYGAYREGE